MMKILRKIFVIWLVFLLLLNPLMPVVLAEETASSITTGEALSETEAAVEANTNIIDPAGEAVDGAGCGTPDININCPGTDSIEESNNAEVSSSNTSAAGTGQNTSSGNSGDVTIQTGEATASAQTSNQINTNIIVLQEATDSVQVEEATPSAEFSITNENNAFLENTETVSAITGENLANGNFGDVSIDSGNATAVGNIVNLINTNIIGSNFNLLFLNLTNQQNDINLFQAWKDIITSDPADQLQFAGEEPQNSLSLLIENSNRAEVNNYLTVSAVSGKNEANDNGGLALNSGEAISLANVTNVVNVNLIGSKFLFAIVNILGSFEGNLILPPREYFELFQNSSQNSISMVNQNQAYVEGSVETVADSGGNMLNDNTGDSNIQTGDAEAISHNQSLLNLNIQQNDWFKILVNHLGQRQGDVLGWSDPEAKEEPEDITVFSTAPTTSTDEVVNNQDTRVSNSNEVKINNQISVQAVSGWNKADRNGMANVVTGGAKALANLFNLANLNVLGSNLFFGAVNILGNWQGNTIFAYPDVTVGINGPADAKPGEEINYNIAVENIGYDDAHDIAVSFELPKGTSYISDTSGQTAEQSGNNLKWFIDTLAVNESLSIDLKVRIDPNLNYEDLLTFWDKLIPNAYALEEGVRDEITAKVEVSTADKQSDNGNDASSIATVILFPAISSNIADDQSSSAEAASTTIEIGAKNNVNDFVYQGDTITFELEVKNTGGETAKNVTVSQDIYDGQPESTGSVEFPLGDIAPAKVVRITFDIQVTGLAPDSYHTIARASGDNISANEAWTYFDIKENGISLIPEVQAQETNQDETNTGEVKGTETCPVIRMRREWWPYALATIFGTLYFIEYTKRKKWGKLLAKKFRK